MDRRRARAGHWGIAALALVGCGRGPASTRPPALGEVSTAPGPVDVSALLAVTLADPAPATPDAAVAVEAVAAPVAAPDDGVRRFRGQDEDALLRTMATRPVVMVALAAPAASMAAPAAAVAPPR